MLWLIGGVPDVSSACIRGARWQFVQARPFKHTAALHIKDLSAVVFGLRRVVRQACGRSCEYLALCDDLGMRLAAQCRFRCRRIHGGIQPSGFASRWFGPGEDRE